MQDRHDRTREDVPPTRTQSARPRQSYEAQIEDTRPHRAKLVVDDGHPLIFWFKKVWREDDIEVLQLLEHRRERIEKAGVGVEVDHGIEIALSGHFEKRPFNRRADFDNIVFEKPTIDLVNIELILPHDFVERLIQHIEVKGVRRPIRHQSNQMPVGMMFAQALVKNPSPIKIAEAEARETQNAHDQSKTSKVTEL